MRINVEAMFLTSKYAVPAMIESDGGSIVNISSISALRPRGLTAYSTSKGAVIALTSAMAVDHAVDKIRVNVVCPGSMNTPLTETIPEEKLAPYREANLMKRFAAPSEIAQAALYLASDEASFVTGSALVADGGYTTI